MGITMSEKCNCGGPRNHEADVRKMILHGESPNGIASAIGHPNSVHAVKTILLRIMGGRQDTIGDELLGYPPWRQVVEIYKLLKSDVPDADVRPKILRLVEEVYQEG